VGLSMQPSLWGSWVGVLVGCLLWGSLHAGVWRMTPSAGAAGLWLCFVLTAWCVSSNCAMSEVPLVC
jgi:hypothetical protein